MKYISGPGRWLTKGPKWTKQKEILEISAEPRGKGNYHFWRKGMGGRSWRVLGGGGLASHQKALSQGSLRPLMWHFVSTTWNAPFPTLPPSRENRYRGIVGEGRTEGPTTLGPISGYQHSHWFPLGEWPTWSSPGKWHKWAMQPLMYIWHYFQQLFTVVYLHDLITYSCTKCMEILLGLFPLQTNSLICFHQQSGVLLHQGTTFKEQLL